MILRSFLAFVFLSSLCGPSFAQEPEPAIVVKPDYFTGIGGFTRIPGSEEFAKSGTILEKKDTFFEFKIKHRRTGILKNDLGFKAGGQYFYDAKASIPAGTLMHAQNFGRVQDPKSGRSASGLAWCAIRKDNDKPICIFWDGSGRNLLGQKSKKPISTAAYIDGESWQSKYYTPSFSNFIIEGGTIPEIEEKGVDFGREMIVRLRFNKFKKGSARLSVVLDDGEKEVPYLGFGSKLRKMKLDENNEVILKLLGQKIKLGFIEKKQAKFEILEP